MAYQALARRADIDELLNARNEALQKFDDAMLILQEASQSLMQAGYGETVVSTVLREARFYGQVEHATVNGANKSMRKEVDKALWRHLGNVTGLVALMDKTALDEWQEGIEKNPPECNLETLESTFQNLNDQKGLIFKRGLVKAFGKLSGKYKTNDAFKLGKRIIVEHCAGSYGHGMDYLVDAERVFYVLDNVKPPEYKNSIKQAIFEASTCHFNFKSAKFETPYMNGKTFKNGNVHISFNRPDLVDKANMIIAAFYGETLAHDGA